MATTGGKSFRVPFIQYNLLTRCRYWPGKSQIEESRSWFPSGARTSCTSRWRREVQIRTRVPPCGREIQPGYRPHRWIHRCPGRAAQQRHYFLTLSPCQIHVVPQILAQSIPFDSQLDSISVNLDCFNPKVLLVMRRRNIFPVFLQSNNKYGNTQSVRIGASVLLTSRIFSDTARTHSAEMLLRLPDLFNICQILVNYVTSLDEAATNHLSWSSVISCWKHATSPMRDE